MHEQEGDGEPAHHARRPMNAFLIFCKRHRSVVRDKYPNLENRSITKILGEWWANLEEEEKACYTDLAKQYKDAFFSANPDFKWYKLPAPPLRTLSSRPRETVEKLHEPLNISYHDVESERTNNNSTKVDFNRRPNDSMFENATKPLSMFTPGKLADEAQMGGLSSLLATKTDTHSPNPYYSPHTYKFTTISTPKENDSYVIESNIPKNPSREDSIRELQNALSETTRIFEEDFDEEKGTLYYYEIPNDQITNQDVIDQIVDKRYSRDDEYIYRSNSSDDEANLKSGRTCKGKRYQEFVGGLVVNKRQKRDCNDRSEENYSGSCSWEAAYSNSDDPNATDDLNQTVFHEGTVESEVKIDSTDTSEQDNNGNKTFKAADFDLDAKIKALPSLSLEKFQQKKRENKRKKKTVNLKLKGHETSKIINSVAIPVSLAVRREIAENWRETVIGSQKRKPRKISITRLEVNSLISSADYNTANKISPEIKIATEAPHTVVHNMDICKPSHHNNIDLFALATLAEVASNTSRIEDISTNINMTAKANDEYASKV